VVEAGIISEDVARPFAQAFARRQQADYADFKQATAEEVAQLRRDVGASVAACDGVLAADRD